MKIVVVGCGALGSYYGARLGQVEPEVSFLLRSDYEPVRARGVRVESVDGDCHVHPRCARDPSEIGVSDLVVIGLKTTANDQFERLLRPLVGPSTLVLTLQNGLGNVERLAALFGPDNILGGLCFICVNRLAPGHIRHFAYGRVVLGEYQRVALPRTRALADLFQRARIPCAVTDDLARAQWEKLIWNVPFNGLGVAGTAGYDAVCAGVSQVSTRQKSCLTTEQLLADPRWEALVRELMAEVISIGRARGHDLADSLAEENIQRTRTMGPYQASTLLDCEKGMPLELDSLFLQPLRHAKTLGVPVPRLEAMCRLLGQLNR